MVRSHADNKGGSSIMRNSLDHYQLSLPAGSLETYIQSVNRIPMLSAEEERDLAERYRRDNDLDAARQLVLSHLRFVVRVARFYRGYGLAQADLIQEGNIGLMKAVKRFDPSIGVRLVSFAVHWIRAEIHEYVLRNWRIVKIATTKAQRKLFFNLRSAKKRLGWLSNEEVTGVANELGVSPKAVLEMEERLNARDVGFDITPDEREDHRPRSAGNYVQDIRFEPEALMETEQLVDQRQRMLENAMHRLDARSREIVTKRWLGERKLTLQELAELYGVSAERIRQLEKNALKKLRTAMSDGALLPAPS